MKLTWFNELCNAQWAGKSRGDVTALSLTDASYQELLNDVLTAGSLVAASHTGVPLTLSTPAGASLTELENPVTRSSVCLTRGADRDSVTVSYG